MKESFGKLITALKNKDIRKKLLYTCVMMLIFRVLAGISTPGIPRDALRNLFGEGGFGDLLTAVSGAVFENASIIAIGLGPYINASVVLQLLGSVVPALEQLQEEGERGKRILNQYTRIITIPFAILQSFVIYSILRSQGLVGALSWFELLTMFTTLTAGTMVLVWIGELIQENGLGNGSSMLIMAGILSGLPGTVSSNFSTVNINMLILIVIFAVLIIAGIIFVTESERRIKIQYAKRVRGGNVSGGGESYIPLKINTAGVMPVIFSVSFLSFPQIISRFLVTSGNEKVRNAATTVIGFLDTRNIYYYIIYIAGIILFTYFYTFIIFKPQDVAKNLKQSGGFIPGIRPGQHTAQYFYTVLSRLTVVGAFFLSFVAILPVLLEKITNVSSIAISGTGLLIVISVILDVIRQMESLSVTRGYEKYR